MFASSVLADVKLDQVSDNIYNALSGGNGGAGIIPLMEGVAYVMGIIFLIKSALKLKEHNETKGQVKLTVPIVFFIAGAIFVTLPTAVSVVYRTIFPSDPSQCSSCAEDKFYDHSKKASGYRY